MEKAGNGIGCTNKEDVDDEDDERGKEEEEGPHREHNFSPSLFISHGRVAKKPETAT